MEELGSKFPEHMQYLLVVDDKLICERKSRTEQYQSSWICGLRSVLKANRHLFDYRWEITSNSMKIRQPNIYKF